MEQERRIKEVEWKAVRERRKLEGKTKALKRLREAVKRKSEDVEERKLKRGRGRRQ